VIEFSALYSDGISSLQRPVSVLFVNDRLVVRGDGVNVSVRLQDVRFSDRLASTARFISLPGGGKCETTDNDRVDQLLRGVGLDRPGHWVHALENSWRYVLVALVGVVLFLAGVIRYGAPFVAKEVACGLPLEVEHRLGEKVLSTMDEAWFAPSELDVKTKEKVRAVFAQVAANVDFGLTGIEFRKGKIIGANAFALPSGIIVITDELVLMAKDPRELLGVLAHEAGHVACRHSLRTYLQNSMVALALVGITGDVSSLMVGVSTLLIQAKYSREFEREADRFAVDLLVRQGVAVSFLTGFLMRLEESSGAGKTLPYISTHPPLADRQREIEGWAAK
jgi:predicted Zn-dependent protease